MANKTTPKTLRRSKTDRVLAGVCAGIAKYFDMDPVIVRVVFALLAVLTGSGFVVYIILWMIIPEEV